VSLLLDLNWQQVPTSTMDDSKKRKADAGGDEANKRTKVSACNIISTSRQMPLQIESYMLLHHFQYSIS